MVERVSNTSVVAHPTELAAGKREVARFDPRGKPPAFTAQRAVAEADEVFSQPTLARSPFRPTQPVPGEAELIGRRPQLERAIAALEVERAHLAIFGDRGFGKTSLANVVASLAENAGFGVVRHACSSGAGFSDLIGAVLDKIPRRFLRRATGDATEAAATMPVPEWTVFEAVAALERIRAGHVLVFIDEFDRLVAPHARSAVAELLKTVSDLGLRVSFVLVGVADSVEELLAMHHSIHRSLVSIPMPLLQDDDLALILHNGCDRLGLRVEPQAEATMLRLAHWSPHMIQLLGLHATNIARRHGAHSLSTAHAAAAARLVLSEMTPVFAPIFKCLPLEAALREGLSWADLLYAAARAPCDPFGWFTAVDVAISQCDADLRILVLDDAGPIFRSRRIGSTMEFSFLRAELRNYLLLRAAERAGLI